MVVTLSVSPHFSARPPNPKPKVNEWRGRRGGVKSNLCTRAGGEEGKAYRKGADGVDGLLIDLVVTHFAECLRDWFYEGGRRKGEEKEEEEEEQGKKKDE